VKTSMNKRRRSGPHHSADVRLTTAGTIPINSKRHEIQIILQNKQIFKITTETGFL